MYVCQAVCFVCPCLTGTVEGLRARALCRQHVYLIVCVCVCVCVAIRQNEIKRNPSVVLFFLCGISVVFVAK